ncbi:MAG: long-chain fatty acid--CoA ligase [Syntrophaceae bacterium]
MLYRNDTLCGIFHNQALRFGDTRVFLKAKGTASGTPSDEDCALTWRQVRDESIALARGLIALGVTHGERVVILSENRPQWIITDQAIQACGAIGVPISPATKPEELAYMLDDCVPRVVIASNIESARMVRTLCNANESLHEVQVIVMEPYEGYDVFAWTEIMSMGRSRVPLDSVEESIQRVIPSDIASIIYTSGTSGLPKGVVLTQSNWVANMYQCTDSVFMQRLKDKDLAPTALVHLPLNHVYARASDYHMIGLYFGGELVFGGGYETLSKDLLDIRPHIITSIPRFYEKMTESIRYAVGCESKPRRTLFNWALTQGEKFACSLATGQRVSPLNFIGLFLAHRLVFDRIKRSMGLERLIFAISGGGKLSKDICMFLRAMRLELSEGYGMTETGTVINFNAPSIMTDKPKGLLGAWFYELIMDMATELLVVQTSQGRSPLSHLFSALKLALTYYTFLYNLRIKPGSVGRPLTGTEEKIAEDGEILIKGPQVFVGYWRLPEETEEIFTADGWLKTGDIGCIDQEGFLEITDRTREIFVTSGGKNVAPCPIEAALTARPYIDQVCLIGESRKYLTALIVPDIDFFTRYARNQGLDADRLEELFQRDEIRDLIRQQVEQVNQGLARYEQIKKFCILSKPFDVASGELTPTLKLKRRAVYAHYQAEIDGMYARWGSVA